MRARYLLLITVVAAGLISAMAIRSAQGEVNPAQDEASRTLTFTAPPPPPRDHHFVDVPPHGLSLGDRDVGAVSLRRHGALFGRALAVCTINDGSFKGQQCAFTLVLRHGTITVQGGGLDRKLPHTPPPSNGDVFAVTGGTGIYAGANGTLTIRHRHHADIFTVKLRG
jgi:hypothetical protein